MIHHVGLEIEADDVVPCLEFWKLLGWEQVALPEGMREAAWLERDGHQIHLQVVALPVAPHIGHVALVDPDLDATVERIVAASGEVHERTRYWGERRIFTRCPAGHRVELMQAPPG
ncbi:MAG: hypothetical protein J7513_14090 [Solirubrobacteraceae bacterium]|nr:hypothetical protein [Solirubrobacteraceae bacterium]